MEIRCLETILDYNMDPSEAKAYKIACIYEDEVRKMFPEESRYKKLSGDPRKRYIFKCCYKLIRETAHKIEDKDYPFYVKSQLDIIKINTNLSKKPPNISPSCLVGDNAWKRWLVWKRIFEKSKKRADSVDKTNVNAHSLENVLAALKADKEFLTLRLKNLNVANIQKSLDGRAMLRWIATKQVSPYYALLSPSLSQWMSERKLTLDSLFHIDFNFFKVGINETVENFFNEQFRYEYDSHGLP